MSTIKQVAIKDVPDNAMHLGQDWQNDGNFNSSLWEAIEDALARGEIVVCVKDSSGEQWSKDYYSIK